MVRPRFEETRIGCVLGSFVGTATGESLQAVMAVQKKEKAINTLEVLMCEGRECFFEWGIELLYPTEAAQAAEA